MLWWFGCLCLCSLQELLHKRAAQFTVSNDYKVEIDCRKMPPELQEEFARVLGEPLFGEERRILSSRSHAPTIGDANRSGREQSIPRLTICILIVGTRGDVQPFIAIGKKLMVCSWYTSLLRGCKGPASPSLGQAWAQRVDWMQQTGCPVAKVIALYWLLTWPAASPCWHQSDSFVLMADIPLTFHQWK